MQARGYVFMVLVALQFGLQPLVRASFDSQRTSTTSVVLAVEVELTRHTTCSILSYILISLLLGRQVRPRPADACSRRAAWGALSVDGIIEPACSWPPRVHLRLPESSASVRLPQRGRAHLQPHQPDQDDLRRRVSILHGWPAAVPRANRRACSLGWYEYCKLMLTDSSFQLIHFENTVASVLLGSQDSPKQSAEANFTIGFLAVLGAAVCSGLAAALSQIALQVVALLFCLY